MRRILDRIDPTFSLRSRRMAGPIWLAAFAERAATVSSINEGPQARDAELGCTKHL